MPPATVRASPEVVLVKRTAALEASSERRDILAGLRASIIVAIPNRSIWSLRFNNTDQQVNFLFEIALLNGRAACFAQSSTK
jgi:hypothetical protein